MPISEADVQDQEGRIEALRAQIDDLKADIRFQPEPAEATGVQGQPVVDPIQRIQASPAVPDPDQPAFRKSPGLIGRMISEATIPEPLTESQKAEPSTGAGAKMRNVVRFPGWLARGIAEGGFNLGAGALSAAGVGAPSKAGLTGPYIVPPGEDEEARQRKMEAGAEAVVDFAGPLGDIKDWYEVGREFVKGRGEELFHEQPLILPALLASAIPGMPGPKIPGRGEGINVSEGLAEAGKIGEKAAGAGTPAVTYSVDAGGYARRGQAGKRLAMIRPVENVADQTLYDFLDYYDGMTAPRGFRPGERGALRNQIKSELLKQNKADLDAGTLSRKGFETLVDAEFNRRVDAAGIALRSTEAGNLVPAVRESGPFVPREFAHYKFKDAKAGMMGGTKDPTRFIQEIDGALSVQEKASLPGQAGPAERLILWRDRDIVKQKIAWQQAMGGRLARALEGLSKTDRSTLTAILEDKTPATTPRLAQAADELRNWFNDALRHQNEARKLRKQTEIPMRKDYTPHQIHRANIWERAMGLRQQPRDIISGPGLPDYAIGLNKPFNERELARLGAMPEFVREMDIGKLANDYIRTASNDIFNTAIIQNNKAFIQMLQSKGYAHAARGLENWTAESFAGVRSVVDRAANLDPYVRRGMNAWRGALARGVFPLNLAWNTFVQTSSGALTVTRYGLKNSVAAGVDWFTNPAARAEVADNAYSQIVKSQESGRITRQDINRGIQAASALAKGPLEKAADAASYFNELVERHLTGWSVLAAKKHGEKAGLRGEALWQYASDGGAKTQSMYNLEDLPGMLRSELVKTAAPFQTFGFEMFNTMREFAGQTGTPPGLFQERMKWLLRFMAATTAFNVVADEAIGRKPWEISSFLPFWQYLGAGPRLAGIETRGGGGRSPFGPVSDFEDFSRAVAKFGWTGDDRLLTRWAIRHLALLPKGGIPGGTQLSRIVDGFRAMADEGLYSGQADGSEKLLFPITSTKDKIMTFFAGPWSTEGGQEYLDRLSGGWDVDADPFTREVVGHIPVVSDFIHFNEEETAPVSVRARPYSPGARVRVQD